MRTFFMIFSSFVLCDRYGCALPESCRCHPEPILVFNENKPIAGFRIQFNHKNQFMSIFSLTMYTLLLFVHEIPFQAADSSVAQFPARAFDRNLRVPTSAKRVVVNDKSYQAPHTTILH
jgi:hypothetical protein